MSHLNWQGWNRHSGLTKLEYFNSEKVGTICRGTCQNCGYHYLNSDGGHLLAGSDGEFLMTDTPLCGVWR